VLLTSVIGEASPIERIGPRKKGHRSPAPGGDSRFSPTETTGPEDGPEPSGGGRPSHVEAFAFAPTQQAYSGQVSSAVG
jgi:hypothetical protein